MKTRTTVLLFAFVPGFYLRLAAQDDTKAGRLSPKELAIPPSPVFDLMGVTPSQINRTADIKDFKVDWSFKSWRLNHNLAIQGQPVWELLYNRNKYQQASSFMRKLASLDFSVGTVQNEDNDRRIGFAVKMNLYKQKDLFNKDGYTVDFGENILDGSTAKEVKVDIALVDFSSLVKAKTQADSLAIIEKIYQDPSKFSIVTGVLNYVTASTAKVTTEAKFRFSITDSKYTMVLVDNDGKDNSGTKTAPERFYKKKGNCSCTSCGCCCYRTKRGCTYCGIVIVKTK
ncbi:MAG: hypothetical protein Q8941_01515 [Bacteroidota bacterium]|nr:hypothetical protein [Bacteroidota bacterium]